MLQRCLDFKAVMSTKSMQVTETGSWKCTIFLETIFTRKMLESSEFIYPCLLMLENIFYLRCILPKESFFPIMGPRGPELNWNKFTISHEFGPLQVK